MAIAAFIAFLSKTRLPIGLLSSRMSNIMSVLNALVLSRLLERVVSMAIPRLFDATIRIVGEKRLGRKAVRASNGGSPEVAMPPDSAVAAGTRSAPLYNPLQEPVIARDPKGATEVYLSM